MSLKDVKYYFLQTQNSYIQAIKDLAMLQEEMKTNNLPQELIDNVVKNTEKLADNYKRISYIMYLFNLPNRKKKKDKYKDQHKYLEDYLEGHTDKEINLENLDALKKIKEIAKEVKEKLNSEKINN